MKFQTPRFKADKKIDAFIKVRRDQLFYLFFALFSLFFCFSNRKNVNYLSGYFTAVIVFMGCLMMFRREKKERLKQLKPL